MSQGFTHPIPIPVSVVNGGTGTTTSTGTGSTVLSSSPTLVSPILGVSTATSVVFSPTTSGIIGVTDGSVAGTGKVGELLSSIIVQASAVSLTSSTPKTVTSITLSAGDWNVWGNIHVFPSVAGTLGAVWISSTATTIPDGSLDNVLQVVTGTLGETAMPAPMLPFNVTTNTLVYLSVYYTFASGTAAACGGIYARRVR